MQDGRWRVVVAPRQGGSVLACEYLGLPLLQPVELPRRVGLPRLTCCLFPLIPFSNRIENGRFRFDGMTIRLANTIVGSPHAMHGHGWLTQWDLTDRDATSCTLAFRHAPRADWPWPYVGRHMIALVDDVLRLELAIENTGATPMPGGLGFHPHLPAGGGARLRLRARAVWNGAASEFPDERISVPDRLDFRDAPRVCDRRGMDHCYAGWDGRATVSFEQPARSLLLKGCRETHTAVVYVPESADYFCVEPVTHAVNAMNLPEASQGGWWTLAPRSQRRISMSIRVRPGRSPAPLLRTSGPNP